MEVQNDLFEAAENDHSPVTSEYDECETTDDTCSSDAGSVSSASSGSSASTASEYVKPLKVTCECGSIIQYQTLSSHRKSIKHRRIMYDREVEARGLIQACIYQICSVDEPDDGIVYIGSTERGKALYKRIGEHRARYRQPYKRQYSSRLVFDKYTPAGCKIKAVRHVLVKDKDELHRLEQETIEQFGERCINIRRAIRSNDDDE